MTESDRKIERFLLTPLRKAAEIAFNTVNAAWYARNGYPKLHQLMGGGEPSYSGKTVTHETALNHSVVWVCTRIIAETVAQLPLHLYRRLDGDAKDKARDHPLYRLLHDAPNDEMSSVEFRETMQAHAVTWGNAYSRVVRQASGRVVALMPPYSPGSVTPKRVKGNIVYDVTMDDGTEKPFPMNEILHIRGLGFDGLVGYSVVTMARNSIGNAMAAEEYVGKFYANGARVPYLLKSLGKFKNDQEAEKFREDWNKIYGSNNFHVAPILEGGLEYQQIGLKPEDSQFLETREFNVPEVCRWFRMPPHLAGDLSRATFANIEHQAIEFVQYTLTPWLRKWEGAISRTLLGRTERGRYFPEFNVAGLLRGDSKARAEYLTSLRNSGMITANEGRAKENWNPHPDEGADDLLIQGAMVPVSQAKQGEDDGT